MLYLASKIETSDASLDGKKAKSKPMTLFQAALFQWVNPKA
ncbi:MAG: threonine/homoserine/homoserine lactone efflux protein [Glaciecola sp.]|jgi:threonine/homoserine/homoserine lactone efflux protein